MKGIRKASGIAVGLALLAAACANTTSERIKASGPAVSVNSDFQVDAEKAARGQQLFGFRGCMGCHIIGGGRQAGPDLFGVTEVRSIEWLTSFLKDTEAMLNTDPIAQSLLKEFGGNKMPNIKLTDPEIEALIHYLQKKTDDLRAGSKS
jgi:mono/diheme cytochrome c family protein